MQMDTALYDISGGKEQFRIFSQVIQASKKEGLTPREYN